MPHTFPPNRSHGFSLVELSIVLVILGLLTGGILAGQSLIRAAELRSIPTGWDRYYTATMNFRDRYMAFPGDMANATRFWGTATSCPGSYSTPSNDATTCDGTGDGSISSLTPSNELFRFWQHLANAGLIEGTYAGVKGPDANVQAVPGFNVPTGKISNTGYSVQTSNYTPNGGAGDFIWSGTRFWFGAASAVNQTLGYALTPTEAWNIDTKMDDGKPGTGRIMTWRAATMPDCTDAVTTSTITAAEAAAASYKLASSSIACALFYIAF